MINKATEKMDEEISSNLGKRHTFDLEFINHLHYELCFVAGVLDLVYASRESEVHLTDNAQFVIIDAGSRIKKLIETL